MSDRHFSHEVWLSKLRDHLTEERYAARTARQCIAVARNFLRCLDEQKVGSASRLRSNPYAAVWPRRYSCYRR